MKKIYMILAVFALLSMSLNAQNANTKKATASTKGQPTEKVSKSKRISFNDVVCGINGMSGILPTRNPNGTPSAKGQSRAPLKINADETTVGPFTGDNFDDDGGLGFGALYPNNQDIRVATILERSEFAQHNGDQLVGFRFALAGQASTNNQVKVYDFFSWPVGTNGYFENANRHTWNLGEWGTASTDYQLINNDLTSTNFSTGSITTSAPWTATSVNNQSNGSFYILSGGNLKFTVPSGYSNADFKFSLSTRGSYYAGTFVFTPSTGTAQTLTTSAANTVYECELTGLSTGDVVTITGTYGSYGYSPDFTYMHVYAKGGTANYLTLTGGQWYEYYLDEPIDFVVNDSIDELFLGYSYEQYPSSSTSELRFPMGVNPESTTHDHAAWLYYPNSSTSDITITVPGNTVNFSSIRVYDTSNNLLTSWYSSSTNTATTSNSSGGTSTYYVMPDGWTVENAYMFQYGSSGSYTGYVSSSSSVNITISKDQLNGNTTVNVVIAAYDDNGSVTMSVNGEGKTISKDTSGSYTWSNVDLATTTYDYGLYGFDFSSYGDLAVQLIFKSSKTAAPTITGQVDPNNENNYVITATGDGTVTLTVGDQTVTGTGSASISIPRTDVDQNVTATATAKDGDKEESDPTTENFVVPKLVTATPTLSMVDNGDGTYTITATATSPDTGAEVTLNVTGYQPVTGTGSASITITQTNEGQPVTATATAQATGKAVSEEASENYTVPALPITPTPSITYVVNGDNVVITATGQGTVTLNIPGYEPATGNGSASITVPRTDETYTVTATATAQADHHQPSATETQQITVPFLQTDKPEITYTTDGENVIITATGDGIVTLNVPGYEPVSGEGSVSVTVPYGVVATTLNVTATAKEEGKAQSETETAQVPIPAGEGWKEMLGDYNNDDDLLSFLVKEGNDTLDIMMVDQFMVSTYNNDHPSGYNYTMRETIAGEELSSSPVPIPVYKTYSTMKGFYTNSEVEGDYDRHLRPGVINSEMDYDVATGNHTYYYGLFRGEMNDDYPTISIQPPYRVSQLQQYDEKVGEQVLHYFVETYPEGIAPKYDHIGNQVVTLLDTNYVQGEKAGDELAYVPVIWTYGSSTARGDGKDNSYGSDIKREKLGGVEATIKLYYTQGAWGTFKDANEVEYCICYPEITITGTCPDDKTDNDGDVRTYKPYLYRAWCTFTGARDFRLNSDGKLVDAGPKAAPFLLDSIYDNQRDHVVTIGGDNAAHSTIKRPWAFGLPVSQIGQVSIPFVVRFYYEKEVVDAQASSNGSMLKAGEGERAYYMVETPGRQPEWFTGVNELSGNVVPVSVTYVNPQGMQSDKPFDGINIVVTRYSNGATTTTKVRR